VPSLNALYTKLEKEDEFKKSNAIKEIYWFLKGYTVTDWEQRDFYLPIFELSLPDDQDCYSKLYYSKQSEQNSTKFSFSAVDFLFWDKLLDVRRAKGFCKIYEITMLTQLLNAPKKPSKSLITY